MSILKPLGLTAGLAVALTAAALSTRNKTVEQPLSVMSPCERLENATGQIIIFEALAADLPPGFASADDIQARLKDARREAAAVLREIEDPNDCSSSSREGGFLGGPY